MVNQPIDVEEALHFLDDLVSTKTNQRLEFVERSIIRQVWEGKKLHNIHVSQFKDGYIQRTIVPRLWKLLSEVTGESIGIRNLQGVLEELRERQLQNASKTSNKSEEETLLKVLPSLGADKSGKVSSEHKTVDNFLPSLHIPVNPTLQGIPKFESQGQAVVPPLGTIDLGGKVPLRDNLKFQSYANTTLRQDWGEAPESIVFYGRQAELAILKQWIAGDCSRLVTIIGMGGIGKTALAVRTAKKIRNEFNYVIWRSLRNAPPIQEILTDLINFLSEGQDTELPTTTAEQLSLLIAYLRQQRCLIILDNCESVLASGELVGRYREGYEEYAQLIRRIGQEDHQSTVVLTSREKTTELALLEVATPKVKLLPLEGLPETEAREILQENQLFDPDDWGRLIEIYRGNPLALMMISRTINYLFNGRVSQFIKRNTIVVDDVLQGLLEEQFERLSPIEKEIMYWLMIERHSVSLSKLRDKVLLPLSESEFLAAVKSLGWRSLIERETQEEEAGFTLQPSVMRYMTKRLVEQVCVELSDAIRTGSSENFEQFRSLRLVTVQQPDAEVHRLQVRLILTPIKDRLTMIFRSDRQLAHYLKEMLAILEKQSSLEVGYAMDNTKSLLATLQISD